MEGDPKKRRKGDGNPASKMEKKSAIAMNNRASMNKLQAAHYEFGEHTTAITDSINETC